MIGIVFINSKLIKGINIDLQIISSVLQDLQYPVKNLIIDYKDIGNYACNKVNKFDLSCNIYIFSEVMLPGLFTYLLNKNKKIVLMPNIDSYSSHGNKHSFIYYLKKFSNSLFVLAKTMQIKNWLNTYKINSFYINFRFYSKNKIINRQVNNIILLDTGSSESKRKYCNEIINILSKNAKYRLVVKTMPNIYKLNGLRKYKNHKNIKIINRQMKKHEIDDLYEKCTFTIYLSKYDSYGLSLAKAIESEQFIFCNNGLPWNEILENYPRKAYIKCAKDGVIKSQQKYKTDFNDLRVKLTEYTKYIDIIKNTSDDVRNFNKLNKTMFKNNIDNFIRLVCKK